MRYGLYILQIFLLLILSCTPKPPPAPVVPPAPAPAVPSWIDGKTEDSLYLYGVAKMKVGNNKGEDLDDIASGQISGLIKQRLKSRLKHVSDSTGTNFIGYMDRIIKSRVSRSLMHMEIAEKYKDKIYEYALARLDKKKYINGILNDKQKAKNAAIGLVNSIDKNISADSFKNISKAVDTISMFLDYYPMIDDSSKYERPIGIVDIARDYIQAYNDRISISFDPDFLESMPLINDNKRIRVSATDQLSGNNIKGVWIATRFSNSDHHDLILTKDDGTTLYQTKPILHETGSYVLSFEVDYSAMMSPATARLLYVKSKTFPLTVVLSAPKIYFENIIKDLDDTAPSSKVVDAIRQCFINKYSAIFVKDKKDSDILLRLQVSTIEHKERVSDIYPYFVHASGSISLTDTRTNVEVFNQEISEQKGSDFQSIEKAGINALKNLAEALGLGICG